MLGAVVGTVTDGAVGATESGITKACSVETLTISRTVVGALLVSTIHPRVGVVTLALSGLAITDTIARAVIGASELRAIRTIEASMA